MHGDDDDVSTVEAPTESAPTTAERMRSTPTRNRPRPTGARYELSAPLARGGMGEIVTARDLQIGREVAIKRMKSTTPSERAMQRFLREARIQGRLDHPAIVPVYELGRDTDGRPFFAMKKLAGRTLAELIATGTAPRQRLLRAFADVCLAIELAHARGVIHRDLKPENIMLGDYGETYVIDWGVAKVLDDTEDLADDDNTSIATAAGAVIGTAGYMAPEQARGRTDIDARADVYSLGCVLFEILAGAPLHPRGNDGIASALRGVDGRPSARAPGRDIPPELDELCVAATALDREQRIASARELGDRVQRYLDGDRDLAQRRTLAQSYFAAAQAALAEGDRPSAMRDVGRALALDPTQRDAADLASRLMLEPPAHVPPEVEASLAEESREVIRRTARAGIVGSLGYVAFAPILVVAGVPALYVVALLALTAVNTHGLWLMSRHRRRMPRLRVLAANAALVAFTAAVCSPFLIAPMVAALTVLGLMSGPYRTWRDAGIVGVTVTLALFAPWAAEYVGLVPSSTEILDTARGATLVIETPITQGELVTYAMLVLSTVLGVAVAAIMTRGIRESERAARRQLHVVTWQLRHLVPE